jgi:hypothetical protein
MKDAWKITKNLKNTVNVSQNSTIEENAKTDVTNREEVEVFTFSPQKYVTTFSDVNCRSTITRDQ